MSELTKYVMGRRKDGVLFVDTRFENFCTINDRKNLCRKGVPLANTSAKEQILSVSHCTITWPTDHKLKCSPRIVGVTKLLGVSSFISHLQNSL